MCWNSKHLSGLTISFASQMERQKNMKGNYGTFYPNYKSRDIEQVKGKTELFKKELTWLRYHINQNAVKPIKDKTEAITKLKAPTNTKELKSFLGSIQLVSKFLNNLSIKTDRKRVLKKVVKWEWTPEIDNDFEQLKKEITEAPCLAQFDPRKDNYVTTDACNTGLGTTL